MSVLNITAKNLVTRKDTIALKAYFRGDVWLKVVAPVNEGVKKQKNAKGMQTIKRLIPSEHCKHKKKYLHYACLCITRLADIIAAGLRQLGCLDLQSERRKKDVRWLWVDI